MTDSRPIIRDGLAVDIPTCLALDATYDTDYVWQMNVQSSPNGESVLFRKERLPRSMEVAYPMSQRRIELALADKQCFVVACGREVPEDGPAPLYGFLVMSLDAANQIALVHDVVVDREYRRHRLGTRLLNVAWQWAQERDLTQMIVITQTKNYPSIEFLGAFGFSFCGYNDQHFRNHDIAVFFGQTLS